MTTNHTTNFSSIQATLLITNKQLVAAMSIARLTPDILSGVPVTKTHPAYILAHLKDIATERSDDASADPNHSGWAVQFFHRPGDYSGHVYYKKYERVERVSPHGLPPSAPLRRSKGSRVAQWLTPRMVCGVAGVCPVLV